MSSPPQSLEINGDASDGDGVDIGKKHKLGHLRVDPQGNATFKRLPTNQLVEALQLGIQYTVGGLETKPSHDVLYQDFPTVEIIHFPKNGRQTPRATPAHRFNDFTIRAYAPVAFRHFREKFNIKPEDFLSSICRPLRELKNPGASGSLFYLTSDDEFILKTVQKKEAQFLKSLLPGYYMNVTQNPRTLLQKFFGLYCYQVTELLPRNKHSTGDNKNIRITVMNNLIPSHVQMHEKYDLKGSTYKRQANSEERKKESPTWKDLDFIERHPNGLLLDTQTYNALTNTIERDCRVLESFHIMDYSFLIGIHQVDPLAESGGGDRGVLSSSSTSTTANPPKRILYSTPMDNIQAKFDEHNKPDDHLAKTGGIPAQDEQGHRLSLYVGIIDILQSYQLRKKLEHTLKSVMTDGNQISVTNPSFYSQRFQKFLFSTVFKKAPPLRESPIKRPENPFKPVVPTERVVTIDDIRSANTLDLTTTTHPFADMSSRIPSPFYHTGSTSSTGTTNSRIKSYYSSLRSTRESEQTDSQSSSTTVYASSHQSDSLFNQPTRRKPGRVLTASFQGNPSENARLKFYQNLSTSQTTTNEARQAPSSPVDAQPTHRRNDSPDYSATRFRHQSSDRSTRL